MEQIVSEEVVQPGTPKIQSPYPALQALLPRLASLSPKRTKRPVFRERKEAEEYLGTLTGKQIHVLNPVWAIDHNDLNNSAVVGWSVSHNPS